MNSEFHQVPYECKWCGKFGHAEASKECPVEWFEKLHKLLTCDACADLLRGRRETVDAVSDVNVRLQRGFAVTKTGTRTIEAQERGDLERTRVSLHMRLQELNRQLDERKNSHDNTEAMVRGGSDSAGREAENDLASAACGPIPESSDIPPE